MSNWKNLAIAGSVGAVILGSGAVAMAATGAGTPTPKASSPAGAEARGKNLLKRSLHGTWVTRDASNAGAFVQHDAIRGEVTDVSATSITVKSADGVSMTFVVDASSTIKVKGGTSIADVHDTDRVAVVGTGTTTLTATHIVGAGALRAKANSQS